MQNYFRKHTDTNDQITYAGGTPLPPRQCSFLHPTKRTARAVAADNWLSIAYGDGSFVAVADTNPNNRVLVSTDNGVTWTTYPSVANAQTWYSITFANGTFVAVAGFSTANTRVMTSP